MRSAVVGGAFLMATSAIGPGFLTQTAVFTRDLGASFGFAILVSVVFDLAAQLLIWRVLIGAGEPAPRVADRVWPGLGSLLSGLVALGGLAFNIGNVAGAGLGLHALTGIDIRLGAALSAGVALAVFLVRDAGRVMDAIVKVLGLVMVVLALSVAVRANPPVGEALFRTVLPERIHPLAVLTIVGGTVGGYITFAGAHRLLEAGVAGPDNVRLATQGALLGISIATVMRVILFLGALGVVAAGHVIDPANPPASVFRIAAGDLGYRIFGLVMWAAALTSVIGSAYTSVTFLGRWSTRRTLLTAVFILTGTVIFLLVGQPVTILVAVGAVNGLILPLALGTVLVALGRSPYRDLVPQPGWLIAAAAGVAVAMAALGGYTVFTQLPRLLGWSS
ncbi:MAG: divalent metal cation transporter [Gemmatimonadales bacterium]|nr:divalent metal cation transporter [Gemmatimonadales bacterium]